MKIEIIRQRVGSIRRQLRKKGIDCLILTKPVDVTYVTAFAGEDSWAAITKSAVYLITDSRYTEQAQKECVQTSIVERKGAIAGAAGTLVQRLRAVRTVAVEKSVSLGAFRDLKKSCGRPLKTVSGILEAQRSIKDTTERAAIEEAAEIAATALKNAARYFKQGIPENELAGIINLEMRKLGCTNGFETIVAFGANASRPHHKPTQRRLKQRDTILIDFGARCRGYCCDITRCVAIGKPTAEYRKAWEVVEKAQAAAIAVAKAGARLVDVDAAPRRVIRDSGYPVYGHGSGHGFGLEIHEIPFLKEDAKGRLQAGQIITIEPGIYLPGKLGVRVEDDILITEDGCQVLTHKCPHAPWRN
ncbi:MAG: aminopeptidase P family protein [Sedimentisphaerales bacterium]|nr:aminopeptidase P family protein [Sedimentisphaerales bacterium]